MTYKEIIIPLNVNVKVNKGKIRNKHFTGDIIVKSPKYFVPFAFFYYGFKFFYIGIKEIFGLNEKT